MRLLNRVIARDGTLPSVCYSTCNNAVIEAQKVGKSALLCSPDSAFMTYRDSCKSCIESNGGNWTSTNEGGQLLHYCDTQPSGSTTPTGGSNSTSSNTMPYDIMTTILVGYVVETTPQTPQLREIYINLMITITTIEGTIKTWSFTKDITLYSQIPATAVVKISRTINGELTTFTFTTTYLQIGSSSPTSSGNQTTSAISVSPPPTFSSEPATPNSHAWIAGPVVGACSGVFIIIMSIFLLWRRRQKKAKAQLEIELHGNSAVKTELDTPSHPQELDVASSKTMYNEGGRPSEPQELPANG